MALKSSSIFNKMGKILFAYFPCALFRSLTDVTINAPLSCWSQDREKQISTCHFWLTSFPLDADILVWKKMIRCLIDVSWYYIITCSYGVKQMPDPMMSKLPESHTQRINAAKHKYIRIYTYRDLYWNTTTRSKQIITATTRDYVI